MRFLFKLLIRLFVLVLILLPFALIGLVYMAVDDRALVSGRSELGSEQMARAKQLIAEHDPRKLQDGEVKTLSISESELNLVAAHLLDLVGNGSAITQIADGSLDLTASLRLPDNPVGRYLNLSLGLTQTSNLPRFRQLRFGRVSVPDRLSDLMLEQALNAWYAETGLSATEVIREVKLAPQRIEMTYQWQSEITEVVRAKLVSPEDRGRIKAYHEHLVEVTERESGTVSLAKLVESMFAFADHRSVGGDPVAENRAAIIVLATYVDGRSLKTLVPAAALWPKPKNLDVKIHRRGDLPKHFMISAALAVTGGGPLSQAIGLYKEVDDSRGGSGFSFKDLIADKAGTRFAERATQSSTLATQLQKFAGGSLSETQLIPDLAGLEENMPEAEFKRLYGGVGGEKYESVVRDIESRIDASPLYQ